MDTKVAAGPKVGDEITLRGVLCRIIKVRPFATYDVEALDGSDRFWRVSGVFVWRVATT